VVIRKPGDMPCKVTDSRSRRELGVEEIEVGEERRFGAVGH